MRKYYSVPLLFLFIAAGIGLFLRWQFVAPTAGIRYTYFLHAHSHVMFLGWVFNILFLAFADHHLPAGNTRRYKVFFLSLQVLVTAMMISFPLQGYGVYSIVFSTLHTVGIMVFVPMFFVQTKKDTRVSAWFARVAWVFFFISTAGPFALGFLMANGLGQSAWYNFSIYYYLHFQYNGFFTFGVFSLFFHMLESRKIAFSRDHALRFGRWMAFACIPAYALSVLFAKPGLVFNGVGFAGAFIQVVALVYLARQLARITPGLKGHFKPLVINLFALCGIALTTKYLLQLASAHPYVAEMAYSMRPVVIAYLHLVLVGVISFFLLAWYIDRGFFRYDWAKAGIILLAAGFAGSELCLVLMPWWSTLTGGTSSAPAWVFAFSVPMFMAPLCFLIACFSRRHS